jgi:hypothetical protein
MHHTLSPLGVRSVALRQYFLLGLACKYLLSANPVDLLVADQTAHSIHHTAYTIHHTPYIITTGVHSVALRQFFLLGLARKYLLSANTVDLLVADQTVHTPYTFTTGVRFLPKYFSRLT